MQFKSIKKNLTNKMNDWFDSIKNKELKDKVKDSLLVSGGSIVSLFLNEQVNDYDIYMQDRNVLLELVKYYVGDTCKILDGTKKTEYIDKWQQDEKGRKFEDITNCYTIAVRNLKENQIKLFFDGTAGLKYEDAVPNVNNEKYYPVFFSPNAITLTDNIQIVIRFFGSPEEIHKTFDFIHATNYFTFKDGLVVNQNALISILTKQLQYQGSLYPLTSIIRLKKFIKRGWNINAGEMLKIMWQISELDLKDFDILEEQLIGVDVAYFGILIEVLRNIPNGTEINHHYICTIIDRVFNNCIEED